MSGYDESGESKNSVLEILEKHKAYLDEWSSEILRIPQENGQKKEWKGLVVQGCLIWLESVDMWVQ